MTEDFKNLPNIHLRQIQDAVLNHINDILHSMGHDINKYKLIFENLVHSRIATEAKDRPLAQLKNTTQHLENIPDFLNSSSSSLAKLLYSKFFKKTLDYAKTWDVENKRDV
ncbi:hypothetical protein RND71_036815 [Anisodus tanguticus]|uniref:Uncharacterized protein n=1 Tax=Anisodus tanguticus TaxID=243964 RepID=A0AAE1UY88_9SOLA|nr:hypothetical protein RND71_036815 [Anisodus tanguticus]